MTNGFVLASASPRRKKLLRRRVRSFRVIPSHIPEPPPRPGIHVIRYVVGLARAKARAVAEHVSRGWVLGADTVVVHRGRIFGKPVDAPDARRMLDRLHGRWHDVFTGLALARRPGGRIWTGVSRTRVKMRRLTVDQRARLARLHLDKAGAYAAQAKGNPFVEKWDGEFENVVGLPLSLLDALLQKAGGPAGRKPFPGEKN